MSGPTPVLDDLAGGAHDLGGHQNEQQGVRVEDDWRIEPGLAGLAGRDQSADLLV